MPPSFRAAQLVFIDEFDAGQAHLVGRVIAAILIGLVDLAWNVTDVTENLRGEIVIEIFTNGVNADAYAGEFERALLERERDRARHIRLN